jgi:hypothetical protein
MLERPIAGGGGGGGSDGAVRKHGALEEGPRLNPPHTLPVVPHDCKESASRGKGERALLTGRPQL